jgi:hypothetical protein
MVTKMVTKC